MNTSTTPQGVSSTGYVFLGTVVCLIGAAIVLSAYGVDDSTLGQFALIVGVAIGVVGVALLLIGLIAKGVALGMEEHRRSL